MIKRSDPSESPALCSWDHLPPEMIVESWTWFDDFRQGDEISARESMQNFINRMAVVHPDSQATMLAYQVAFLLDAGCRHRALLLLCKSGADVSCVDTATDATMLHHAARNGHAALTELLLRVRETEVNAVCRAGGSALHIAAQLDHATVVSSLLRVPGILVRSNGSLANSAGRRSVDSPSQDSDTPLRRAVAHGSHKALEALISHPVLRMYCEFGEGQFLYRLTRKLCHEGESESAQRCAAVLAQHGWGPSFEQCKSLMLPPMGSALQRAPCNNVPESYLGISGQSIAKADLSSDCLAELQAAAERVAEQVLCEDDDVPANDKSLRISCQANARHCAYPSHPHPLNNLGEHEDFPDFMKTKRGKRAGRARLLHYKKKKQEEKERKRAVAAGGYGFVPEVAQQAMGFNPALKCPSHAETMMSRKNTGAVTFARSHLMMEDCLDRHHRQDTVQEDHIRCNIGHLGLIEKPVIKDDTGRIGLDQLSLYNT